MEVQVAAAGVNFRDVMKTLGIYPMQPGDVPWLGDEFAGQIVAVGDGVPLAVGDEVFGVAPASFGKVISTPCRLRASQAVGDRLRGSRDAAGGVPTALYSLRAWPACSRGSGS